MTTIAYREGVLAADSRETSGCEDTGQLAAPCMKLFKIERFVVALQGDTTPGMAWLYWFRKKAPIWAGDEDTLFPHPPDDMIERFLANDADFTAVVLCPSGRAMLYDEWGVPQAITAPYYAVGSGAKVAYGAMFNGAGAVDAVKAACAHDPYTAGPVHSSKDL